MGHTAYVGLGSNLGDRAQNLKRALGLLEQTTGIKMKKVSSTYKTAPVGFVDQPFFLNQAVKLCTVFGPEDLLAALLGIEERMGRKRLRRWGPRNIDLDLLLYDEDAIDLPNLVVPHPRIAERAFVIIPLLEIEPDLTLPGGTKLSDLLTRINLKEQGISLYSRGCP